MADPDRNIQEDDNVLSSIFKYDENKAVEYEEEAPGKPKRGCGQVFWFYDWSFLICVGVSNFAQGFRRLLELGLYFVFKEKLGLQPGEITLLLGIMAFPWIAKIFLAIFSDNVSACGSRRKSYLIINSTIIVISIVLLMIWGITLGKEFIMFCIVTSQVGMTWVDAITDALIAQASRKDLKNGAADLNSFATVAGACGGITACCSAGLMELFGGEELDPNVYFGTYMGLICLLLISAIFLNRDFEPEFILHQRLKEESRKQRSEQRVQNPEDPESVDSGYSNATLCTSCGRAFSAICVLFRYKEWYLTLLFFFIVGIFLPNFDDLHYVFLTSTCNMEKYVYDFLNSLTFVTMIILTFLYNSCLQRTQAWLLTLVSLLLFIVMTSLMLVNALRLNIEIGVSDEVWNVFIFLLGTNAVSLLAILPTQVILISLIPHNVEASTQAIISGIFIWAFEVGAKISGSVYCSIFDVDDDHMDNYPHVLEAKLPMIVVMMILTLMLPNNGQIFQLAGYLRRRHRKYLQKLNQNSDYIRDALDEDQEGLLQNEGGSKEYGQNRQYNSKGK